MPEPSMKRQYTLDELVLGNNNEKKQEKEDSKVG